MKAERVFLDAVDSTNAECFRKAPSLTGPLWIVAAEQTAGRGRRARVWQSPRGNFFGSLILHLPDEPPLRKGLRSFVAALGLYDACVSLTGMQAPFALKWPNDLLLNGCKLSGILLEATGPDLVIGIGVNLIAAPPRELVEEGAVPPVSLLAETGMRFTPKQFLEALDPALTYWEERLVTEGFAPLREAFLARAARLGEQITARTGHMTRVGTFETIDNDGNLILRMEDGIQAIPAADVFF